MRGIYQVRLADLQVFVEVARTLNYTHVAHALSYSEPGVYLKIKALERAMGVKLFARSGRGLALTPAGSKLVGPAHAVLRKIAELDGVSEDLRRQANRTVVVAAGHVPGAYILPKLIAQFLEVNKDLSIQLHVLPEAEIFENVADGGIDIGVRATVGGPPRLGSYGSRRVDISPWLDLPVVVVAGSRHYERLCGEIASGKEVKLLVIAASPVADGVVMKWKDAGTEAVMVELETAEAVKQACLAGLGAALLTRANVEMELGMGLMRVIPSPADSIEPRMYIAARRTLPPTAAQLLRFLQAAENAPVLA